MTGRLKLFGLALVAVAAMSAVGAQGAGAVVNHEFNSEISPTTLTAEQLAGAKHKFTFQGKTTECNKATFVGTVTGKVVDHIRLHPSYSECLFAGIGSVVTTTGCDYTFDSDTTVSPHFPTEEHAPMSVVCNHGAPISMNIGGGSCFVTIGDTHPPAVSTVNQNLEGVTYTNEGVGTTRDIMVHFTIKTTTYVVHGPFCGIAGIKTGTFHDGEYSGTMTVTGEEDKAVGAAHVGTFITTP